MVSQRGPPSVFAPDSVWDVLAVAFLVFVLVATERIVDSPAPPHPVILVFLGLFVIWELWAFYRLVKRDDLYPNL